jgi:polyketide cyclase/dehydrase/lipid transport protein
MTLTYILIALAAVVVVFLIVVALRPADFRVSRSTTISGPASAAFELVNDFHNWEQWSPWEKIDPAARKTYEGPRAGVGAIYRWIGNNKVGEGSGTITESRPRELVRIKLEFLKPFKATNTAEFAFQPRGDQTAVTWSMFGKNNFMMKAFGLFMNCENMVGKEFEKGLAQMKSAVEASPNRVPASAMSAA